MKRKTIPVEDIREQANRFFQNSNPGLTFGVDRDTVPHSFPDESRIFFY
jgi:hypothetical protein